MPIFFFNTFSDGSFFDRYGVELVGIDEARHIAIRHAGEIFQDETEKLVSEEDWRLEVLDEAGAIVFDIKVHLWPPASNVVSRN